MASAESGIKRPYAVAAADWAARYENGQLHRPKHGLGGAEVDIGYGGAAISNVAEIPNQALLMKRCSHFSPTNDRLFNANATVVLTGMPGSGKSTLAVIASAAMKRRIVDLENVFQETHAISSAAYKRKYGTKDYSKRQSDILSGVFIRYAKGTIIVCSWMERNVQTHLSKYISDNPVIYILREADAIKNYLRLLDNDRVQNLLDASGIVFRKCTQFEFFNVSETPTPRATDCAQRSPTPYLTLKRAEHPFPEIFVVAFSPRNNPIYGSEFPLASIPPEQRNFTYSLSLRQRQFVDENLDIEELDAGVDMIEIIVDNRSMSPSAACDITCVLGRVRRSTVVPILYHSEYPEMNGCLEPKAMSEYTSSVFHGLRLAPEYISVDLRLEDDEIIAIRQQKGRCKLLGNVSWSQGTPPPWKDMIWLSFYKKAQRLGCDLIRLTRTVVSFTDNFDLATFKSTAKATGSPVLPLIAYNLGPGGRHSAFLNQIFTSVRPECQGGAEHIEKGLDERLDPPAETKGTILPSLTAREATLALQASFITTPRKLYVVGAKVDYSLSPAMHNAALSACGIPYSYHSFSTPSRHAVEKLVSDPDFGGASIGLPFKRESLLIIDCMSQHAQAIGAVNTIIPIRRLLDDGTVPGNFLQTMADDQSGPICALYGENTDWIGIRACLRQGLSPANAVRATSSALIIGAGGMARAAVYAALQLGVKNIAVFNRTPQNAEKLVDHFRTVHCKFPMLGQNGEGEINFVVLRTLEDHWPSTMRLPTMIVSCIPTHGIGAKPAPNFTLPSTWLGSATGGVLVELAYKTLDTPLLQQSRSRARQGWVTMDGLDLLPEQGFAQFEMFTGRRAPRRLMRRVVFQRYTDEQGRSNLPRLLPRLHNIVEHGI